MAVTDPDVVAGWVAEAGAIVALTGAGISTDSGIPDFRGPKGVWTLDPKAERMSDISYYVSDPEVRVLAWQSRMEHPAWTAGPNDGHRALVTLEQRGVLRAVVTQNIDGLQQQAGSDPDRVVEVHGTMREVTCLSCGDRNPMTDALDRVRAGEADPPCLVCGGILKSATVSFGQQLDPARLDRAFAEAEACDLLLCIGTTLRVQPIAAMAPFAAQAGARVVTVNGEPTDFDDRAHAVLRGDIATILRTLVPPSPVVP